MLSVLLPTIGRETLRRTLESIDHKVDLVIVGHEAPPEYKDLADEFGARWFEYEGPKVQGGGPVRDWALAQGLCEGSHVAFQDDHDAFVAGALEKVEKTAGDIPALYAFIDASGNVLDPDRPLQHGQVDGHQLVVPNAPGKFGEWTDVEYCDWVFIQTTIKRWGYRYDKHYFPISTARIR